VGEEPASGGVVSAGSSSDRDEEGSVVMIATFLLFVMGGQREPVSALSGRDLVTARKHRRLPGLSMRISAASPWVSLPPLA
jgi:hypothetical protein